MRAMILAAGRGERLRPLTDECPKPLIHVGDKRLIEYHIEKLVQVGINDLVINVSHLGYKVKEFLGDGSRFGVSIHYSMEDEALETAGGICKALPLLGDEPFLVVNGDVFTQYDFSKPRLPRGCQAHLVLVPNPEHHPGGDFGFSNSCDDSQTKRLSATADDKYTFSGIGCYHPNFFSACASGVKQKLAPLLRQKMDQGLVSGEFYQGAWIDVGTQERLQEAVTLTTFMRDYR